MSGFKVPQLKDIVRGVQDFSRGHGDFTDAIIDLNEQTAELQSAGLIGQTRKNEIREDWLDSGTDVIEAGTDRIEAVGDFKRTANAFQYEFGGNGGNRQQYTQYNQQTRGFNPNAAPYDNSDDSVDQETGGQPQNRGSAPAQPPAQTPVQNGNYIPPQAQGSVPDHDDLRKAVGNFGDTINSREDNNRDGTVHNAARYVEAMEKLKSDDGYIHLPQGESMKVDGHVVSFRPGIYRPDQFTGVVASALQADQELGNFMVQKTIDPRLMPPAQTAPVTAPTTPTTAPTTPTTTPTTPTTTPTTPTTTPTTPATTTTTPTTTTTTPATTTTTPATTTPTTAAAEVSTAKFYNGVTAETAPIIAAENVLPLQQRLAKNPEYAEILRMPPPKNPDGLDGMYGNRTQKVVAAVCAAAGISDPHNVNLNDANDPETKKFLAELERQEKAREQAAAATVATTTPAPTTPAPTAEQIETARVAQEQKETQAREQAAAEALAAKDRALGEYAPSHTKTIAQEGVGSRHDLAEKGLFLMGELEDGLFGSYDKKGTVGTNGVSTAKIKEFETENADRIRTVATQFGLQWQGPDGVADPAMLAALGQVVQAKVGIGATLAVQEAQGDPSPQAGGGKAPSTGRQGPPAP